MVIFKYQRKAEQKLSKQIYEKTKITALLANRLHGCRNHRHWNSSYIVMYTIG